MQMDDDSSAGSRRSVSCVAAVRDQDSFRAGLRRKYAVSTAAGASSSAVPESINGPVLPLSSATASDSLAPTQRGSSLPTGIQPTIGAHGGLGRQLSGAGTGAQPFESLVDVASSPTTALEVGN